MTATPADDPSPQLPRRVFIDGLLDAARPTTDNDHPDGTYADTDWIDAAGIPQKIRDRDVHKEGVDRTLLDAARREAKAREGEAAKSGNKALRRWLRGEVPLTWDWLGTRPVKVDGKRKCRMDQVTPQLLEDAADYRDKVGRSAYGEVLVLVDAMRELAKAARRAGHSRVAELGDDPMIDRSRWAQQPLALPGTEPAEAEAEEDAEALDDDYDDEADPDLPDDDGDDE